MTISHLDPSSHTAHAGLTPSRGTKRLDSRVLQWRFQIHILRPNREYFSTGNSPYSNLPEHIRIHLNCIFLCHLQWQSPRLILRMLGWRRQKERRGWVRGCYNDGSSRRPNILRPKREYFSTGNSPYLKLWICHYLGNGSSLSQNLQVNILKNEPEKK